MSPIILVLAGAKLTLALLAAVAGLMSTRKDLAMGEVSALDQSQR